MRINHAEGKFTVIPNALLEWLYSERLTSAEYAVILVAIRRILGWPNAPKRQLSISFWKRLTHRDRESIRSAIVSLKARGSLSMKQEAVNGRGRMWEVNTNPTSTSGGKRHTNESASPSGGKYQSRKPGHLEGTPNQIKIKLILKKPFKDRENTKSSLPISEAKWMF